jgi:hypothetical protein
VLDQDLTALVFDGCGPGLAVEAMPPEHPACDDFRPHVRAAIEADADGAGDLAAYRRHAIHRSSRMNTRATAASRAMGTIVVSFWVRQIAPAAKEVKEAPKTRTERRPDLDHRQRHPR